MKKKFLFYVLIIIILFTSCVKNEIEIERHDILDYFRTEYIKIEENKEKMDEESLNRFILSLSDEETVAQLFLISLDGNSKEQITHIIDANRNAPGGYLLFAFNIPETPNELIDFLSSINEAYLLKGNIPPFISIDHEGGVVNRLRNICSKLPSQLSIAQKFSKEEAQKLYELQGIQLKNLGIHVNIAPVVEILTEDNIQFLDDRSFGNFSDVVTFSNAQTEGMHDAGILPVLKHFPGNTNNDPHTGLPILNCSTEELESNFLMPFYKLTKGNETGVLVAHTVIPSVDDKPSCLSEKVLSLLNSENNNFDGLVFSDDLLMKALIKNGYPVEKSLIYAINAGINILMISTGSYDEYEEIVLKEYQKNNDFKNKVDESVKKISEWKVSNGLLQRKVKQIGFFEYETEIILPEVVSQEQKCLQEEQFKEAYTQATELYNSIWWSR